MACSSNDSSDSERLANQPASQHTAEKHTGRRATPRHATPRRFHHLSLVLPLSLLSLSSPHLSSSFSYRCLLLFHDLSRFRSVSSMLHARSFCFPPLLPIRSRRYSSPLLLPRNASTPLAGPQTDGKKRDVERDRTAEPRCHDFDVSR